MKVERWTVERPSKLPQALFDHGSLHIPSLKQARRLIESGRCSINGRVRTFASATVSRGDVIEVVAEGHKKSVPVCSIVYEDQWLLVLDKPAGLLVEQKTIERAIGRPCILVHRLDKETSGLLLLAKDRATADRLEEMFRERLIQKEYIAVVDGPVDRSEGKLFWPMALKHRGQGEVTWGVSDGGKPAQTDFTRLKVSSRASLMVLRPFTGRTHQLRVHMAHMGHPILGDYRYGQRFLCDARPMRQMLHATTIRLCHPVLDEERVWRAPIPQDMEELVKKMFRIDIGSMECAH